MVQVLAWSNQLAREWPLSLFALRAGVEGALVILVRMGRFQAAPVSWWSKPPYVAALGHRERPIGVEIRHGRMLGRAP